MTTNENPGSLAGATGVNKVDQLSTPVVERHTAWVHATQRSRVFTGVDIGLEGAIALLTVEGALIDIVDMPCLAAGAAGRRALNAPLIADILAKTHASHAFVELVGAGLEKDLQAPSASGRAWARSKAFSPHSASPKR